MTDQLDHRENHWSSWPAKRAGQVMVGIIILMVALYIPEPVAFRRVGTIIGAILFLLTLALYVRAKRAEKQKRQERDAQTKT